MSQAQRYIAHFDLDSFFVSVEVLLDPALKNQPVIVGGSRERGVVAAASYAVRKFGVHSAMSMAKALQLCPGAIVIKGTRGAYSQYSKIVTDIIASKAPLFQKASIDEFYIDLTGMDKFFDVYQWTINLRKEIIDKTGLPISFGLASNKMVAKIATDEAKPNGYLYIRPGMEKVFLGQLAVSKIPGVGKQAYGTLKALNIYYIKDILNYTPEVLEEHLGKWGRELWQKANGWHDGEVHNEHEAKSISTENTFNEFSANTGFLLSELVRMTEKVAHELREDEKLAGCIAVKIRYPDFETTSRQTSINYTFNDDELIEAAKKLFSLLYRKGQPVRLLGVRLSDFTAHAMQGSLFEDFDKKASLYKAIDAVKNKWGNPALQKGRAIRKRE